MPGSIKNLKVSESSINMGLAASMNRLLLNNFVFYDF